MQIREIGVGYSLPFLDKEETLLYSALTKKEILIIIP
jgi:hypothetical protein